MKVKAYTKGVSAAGIVFTREVMEVKDSAKIEAFKKLAAAKPNMFQILEEEKPKKVEKKEEPKQELKEEVLEEVKKPKKKKKSKK